MKALLLSWKHRNYRCSGALHRPRTGLQEEVLRHHVQNDREPGFPGVAPRLAIAEENKSCDVHPCCRLRLHSPLAHRLFAADRLADRAILLPIVYGIFAAGRSDLGRHRQLCQHFFERSAVSQVTGGDVSVRAVFRPDQAVLFAHGRAVPEK